MQPNPTVSVVIPCFNYGRYLTRCVASVLSQEGVDVQVLIVDDASSDDSAIVAANLSKEDRRIEFLVHEANQGHIATYNYGLLEWANGDYSVLLSADDWLTSGALARATAVLEAHPEVGFVYGRPAYTRGDDAAPTPRVGSEPPTVWAGDAWIRALCRLGHSVISSPEVVVRTKLQQELGGYNPQLPHTGDLEMWLRLATHADVAYVHADQAYYRRHDTNMTHARSALVDLEQRRAAFDTVFDEHADRIPQAEELRARLRHRLAREALWTACRAYDRGRLNDVPVPDLVAFAYASSTRALWCRESFGLRWRQRLGPRVVPIVQPLVLSAVSRRLRNRLWWHHWARHGI